MLCSIFDPNSLTMPYIALVLAVIMTLGLSTLACLGYDENNKKTKTKSDTSKENIKGSTTNNLKIQESQILEIAKTADFIVNGYAFTFENNQIRILNLNNINKSTTLNVSGEVLMTSMDDIEISIVKEYFERNKEFLREK